MVKRKVENWESFLYKLSLRMWRYTRIEMTREEYRSVDKEEK
jgi:hypothetical protein